MLFFKISELCNKKGISIAKLERETNISNGTISRWSTSSPTVENLTKVADRLGVSLDYLMGREQKEVCNSGCEASE